VDRQQLQFLAKARIKEASILYKSGCFAGSYYLSGYAVECALKACIAKQTRKHDFPDRKLAQDAWVHDPEKLARTAGLLTKLSKEMQSNKALEMNWTTVKDWSETFRYEFNVTQTRLETFWRQSNPSGMGF
jgi:HEPN domain-containing protein